MAVTYTQKARLFKRVPIWFSLVGKFLLISSNYSNVISIYFVKCQNYVIGFRKAKKSVAFAVIIKDGTDCLALFTKVSNTAQLTEIIILTDFLSQVTQVNEIQMF